MSPGNDFKGFPKYITLISKTNFCSDDVRDVGGIFQPDTVSVDLVACEDNVATFKVTSSAYAFLSEATYSFGLQPWVSHGIFSPVHTYGTFKSGNVPTSSGTVLDFAPEVYVKNISHVTAAITDADLDALNIVVTYSQSIAFANSGKTGYATVYLTDGSAMYNLAVAGCEITNGNQLSIPVNSVKHALWPGHTYKVSVPTDMLQASDGSGYLTGLDFEITLKAPQVEEKFDKEQKFDKIEKISQNY